jgi:glycosyltransferase involved in cell wall biosynthesis
MRITFWLGKGVETWDPSSAVDTGIGGSELAAIFLTRELACLGHEIVVFADVPCDWHDRDWGSHGVRWIPYPQWEQDPSLLECDAFVSSRVLNPPCWQALKAGRKLLWMHDLHVGADWRNHLSRYDSIVCLSAFARGRFLACYPSVDPGRVPIIGNGLHGMFEAVTDVLGIAAGDQHGRLARGEVSLRVIWSSSPDRGLGRLLDMWPAILKAHPGAELHVYYGFEGWEKSIAIRDAMAERRSCERLKLRIQDAANVILHGRVGQMDLVHAFLLSHLWLYPTDFLETFCITALEACAAGCKMVATGIGALPETAMGARFVQPPAMRSGYEEEFLAAVELVLAAPALRTGGSIPRWRQIAADWDALLKRG